MQTSHCAIQGANGVAIGDSKNQIIVQAEAFGQGSEQSVLEPCIEDLQATLEKLNPGVKKEDTLNNSILLADSGYHSEENLKYLSEQNINSYIADNQFRKRDPRFKDADRFKTTKGLDRFSMRGKGKINAQWKLFCIIHNLANYGPVHTYTGYPANHFI